VEIFNKLPLSLKFILKIMSIKLIAITFIDWFKLNFIFRSYTLDEYLIFLDWERDALEYILELREGDVVVDVGAYIGSYTIRCAKLVGEKGKVIAIEPLPENIVLLKENIKFNNLNNVYIENVAISNKPNKVFLYYSDFAPSNATIKQNTNLEIYNRRIMVNTATLDSIVKKYNLGKIDLLKVDVEGDELEVINSPKTLKVTRRIIIEVFPKNFDEALSILKAYGFVIKNLGLHHGGANYYLYCYK